jgi:hypothetical protein
LLFALTSLLSCITLIASLPATSHAGESERSNKFVAVDVSLERASLKPGQQSELRIEFTPIDGIHVNVDPPIEITIQQKRTFLFSGKSTQPVDKMSGYLSTAEPVRQRFSVSKKTQPGKHLLKANIVYYFCSDDEGWCRKFTLPVELQLTVEK